MTMPQLTARDFTRIRAGAEIGVAASGLLAVVILVALIPTNEFRARLWFLLDAPGDVSLHFGLWFVGFLMAALAAVAVRRAHRWELLGAGVGSMLTTLSLSLGGYRWIPEFHVVSVRVVVVLVTLVVVAILLWRQRTRGTA